MIYLFAQADADLTAYSPDWWLAKFERYGYGGSLMLLVLWMLWKYVPRIIEAFIAATSTVTESTTANKEAIATLVSMKRSQNESLQRIVATQEAAVGSAKSLVELTTTGMAREEQVVDRACDLVELVTTRIAPDLLEKVMVHTAALRALARGRSH